MPYSISETYQSALRLRQPTRAQLISAEWLAKSESGWRIQSGWLTVKLWDVISFAARGFSEQARARGKQHWSTKVAERLCGGVTSKKGILLDSTSGFHWLWVIVSYQKTCRAGANQELCPFYYWGCILRVSRRWARIFAPWSKTGCQELSWKQAQVLSGRARIDFLQYIFKDWCLAGSFRDSQASARAFVSYTEHGVCVQPAKQDLNWFCSTTG